MPAKLVWVSLYKKHRIGSVLKEGNKQYKVVEVVGPGPAGQWAHKLKVLPVKNPSKASLAKWTPAHAVRIRNGKLEIMR